MSVNVSMHAPPLLGEVRFQRHGDLLLVDHATPVMWFARHVLERTPANPDIGLSFDGTHVTLQASNGRWVWRLTGRSCTHRWTTDGEAFDMVEGRWPD